MGNGSEIQGGTRASLRYCFAMFFLRFTSAPWVRPCTRPRDQGGLRLTSKEIFPIPLGSLNVQGGPPETTRGDAQSISFLIPAYTCFRGRRRGTGYAGGKIINGYSWGLTLDRDALKLVLFHMGIMEKVLSVLAQ